jgi:CBS domain-containing protein
MSSAEWIRAHAAQVPVSAMMTASPLCVRADMSVESLARLLVERGISGAPVVDEAGRPIGVVSKSDLVRHSVDLTPGPTERTDESALAALGAGFHLDELVDASVGDIMMPIAFTVRATDSLSRAATLMGWEGVHRLPVVTDDGTVVGILSSLDVMRWLAPRDS